MPNGGDRIWRKRQVHSKTHTAMAEGRPNSLLSSISYGEDESFLSYTIGKAMVAQALPHSVHLPLVHERKIEMQDDTDSSKPIPIQTGRGLFARDNVLLQMGTIWRKFSI